MIVTAGGIDTHIHFISPQQIDCALYSGVTTMIGGGTGPADGTNATTCTPGLWNLEMMLKAAEEGARQGMENTKNYVAKFGRAKSLLERAIGHQDAGATSVWLIFQGMREFVEGKLDK